MMKKAYIVLSIGLLISSIYFYNSKNTTIDEFHKPLTNISETVECPDKSPIVVNNKEYARSMRYSKPVSHRSSLFLHTGNIVLEDAILHKEINKVLRVLPNIRNTNAFHNLIFETMKVETNKGIYPIEVSNNADMGILQIRLATAKETLEWLKYKHKDVYKVVTSYLEPSNKELKYNLEYNVSFSIALAACYYWRRNPIQSIKTITDRAIFWKTEYNSSKGKGSVNRYIKENKKEG